MDSTAAPEVEHAGPRFRNPELELLKAWCAAVDQHAVEHGCAVRAAGALCLPSF